MAARVNFPYKEEETDVTTEKGHGSPDWSGRVDSGRPLRPGFCAAYTPRRTARAIGAVRVESNQPGELEVSWDAPTATPREYRIMWVRVDESFPSYRDNDDNAYPTEPTYTITGLDEGVRYKVKVRARYSDNPRRLEQPGRGCRCGRRGHSH